MSEKINNWITNHIGTLVIGVLTSVVSVGGIAAWFTDNIKQSFIEWNIEELNKKGIKPIPLEFDIQLDYAQKKEIQIDNKLSKHDSILKGAINYINYQKALNGVFLRNIYCDTVKVFNGHSVHKLCKYNYVELDSLIYRAYIEGSDCYIYEFQWKLKQGENNRKKL